MRSEASERIKYIKNLFAQEDSLLTEIRENLSSDKSVMQLGAEEAKILQFLIHIGNVKKVVELGTLAGYSAIWMARALPEDGKIFTIEMTEEHANMARRNFSQSEVAGKIELIFGKAQEKLSELSDKAPFDMIFIDADKISYPKYLDWAEKNIRKGGLIVADNTFLFNTVYKEKTDNENISPEAHKAMREFNKRLSDDKKYMSIMIPSEEGMTISIKLF